MPKKFTCYVVGEGALLLKCSEILLDRGHEIYGIISSNSTIKYWAISNNIKTLELNDDLANHLNSKSYDYLFSIINLSMLPVDAINSPQKCAINFHDGPLPKYAGLNVTSWAIMNQEKTHGVTWHEITSEVDKGDILKQDIFAIAINETSLSLNARCFERGLSSFKNLVDELANGTNRPIKQNLDDRTYFGKNKRPAQAAIINWNSSSEEISALARALDFGRYANPLGLPKVKVGDEYFIIQKITITDISSTESPGVITTIHGEYIRVATRTNEMEFKKGLSIDGVPLSIPRLIERYSLRIGFKFDKLDAESAMDFNKIDSSIAKREGYWVNLLSSLEFPNIHYAKKNIALEELSNFQNEQLDLPKEVLNYFMNLDPNPQISLASAFGIFIGRHCGKSDFNIGYSDIELLENIKGHGNLFSEYVPLRVAFDSKTSFSNAMTSLANTFIKTAENKTYSRDIWGRYHELNQYLKGGGKSVSPINIAFSQDIREYKAQRGSLITFVIPSDLKSCGFVFDSFAMAGEDIKLLKAQFISFLEEISTKSDQEVGRIGILLADERNKLLEEWNDTKVIFPATKCIHQLFEEQAVKTPEAIAVVCQGESYSYRELNERSNQLAHRLQELGVKPETLVGVYLRRSLDMIVAVMGTLKAGGAYVPLDPLFPKYRISYMIKDSKCSVIITEKGLKDELGSVNANVVTLDAEWNDISKEESGNLNCGVRSENLSYVIYTSGSTGKPKGVMVEHRNVVNFFTGMDACIGHDPGSTWLAVTSLSFDISVLEIFWTLARGFRVVIYEGEESNLHQTSKGLKGSEHDALSIPELMRLHNVTHFQSTPSMASMLMLDEETKGAFGRLKKLLIGGEAFPATLASQLQKVVNGDIVNMYGPTETTVWSTTYKLRNGQQNIPIGRPIANTKIYILDENMQPVPVRVPGELMIGGAGVVRGYLKRPDLTAERFIRNPFSDNPESRLYRTGDLARYLPDGNIEFMGRIDHQVKIRGYRIELGEIETVLNDHPAVYESVVIVREDVPGQKRLVAYVIPREGESLRPSELRNYAREKLPDYMVPAYVVTLKAFPKTPNKKIDRKSLSPPQKGWLEQGASFEPPHTDIEEALAGIWAEALGIQQVGRNENFFDLGGDSLSACQIILSIKQTCNVDLPLLIMFHAPTVAALAEKLEETFQKQAASQHTNFDSIDVGALPPREEGHTGLEARFEPPRTPTEKVLATIWAKTLRVDHVSRNDHFFRLGGKSLDAVKLFMEIEKEFGKRLPLSTLLQVPTLAQLANVLHEDGWEPNWSPLVPIQPTGSRLPFFCMHAHRGNVLNYYPLAHYLGPEQPFYGLQARGLDGEVLGFRTFAEMAADYVREIQTVQPRGPYLIGGWCMGGYIALEMAHLLKAAGEEAALLVLIDTAHPRYLEFLPRTTIFHRLGYKLFERIDYEVSTVRTLSGRERLPHLWRKANAIIPPAQAFAERLIEVPLSKLHLKVPHSRAYKLQCFYDMHDKAYKTYDPLPYQGRVVVLRSSKQPHGIHPDPALGWGDLLKGELELREIPGHYINLLIEPSVRLLAEELKNCLQNLNP
jgi:amino acid adenylation domain-containing protein